MSDFEQFVDRIAGLALAQKPFDSPYAAGRDAKENGANTGNCHFGWFATVESKDEWQRGYDNAVKL
jgi:hypothetical protein